MQLHKRQTIGQVRLVLPKVRDKCVRDVCEPGQWSGFLKIYCQLVTINR